MDINKIIACYCHTINESLIPERIMPETTTAETVRESLTELTMTLKIHDLPSVLDMVYKKLIESAKPNELEFIFDRLIVSEKCQQEFALRSVYEHVMTSPSICPCCQTPINVGEIGCASANYSDFLCEKCYYFGDHHFFECDNDEYDDDDDK